MRSTSKLSLILAACALLASTGCVEYDASLVLDMSFPPLITPLFAADDMQMVCPIGTGGITFQGTAENAGKIFFGSANLNLSTIRDGQPIIGNNPNCPVALNAEPGVFSLYALVRNRLEDSTANDGSGLRLDQNITQVSTIKVKYLFSTGELEFERTISKLLSTSGGGAELPVVFLNGLGELQLLTRSFTAEAAALSGSIITIPVEVQILGETTAGTPAVSNIFTFPITMCNNCTEIGVTQRFVVDNN